MALITIPFTVTGQQLEFSQPVLAEHAVGSIGASFSFSTEWATLTTRTATFATFGASYDVALVSDACTVPSEALTASSFRVSVRGSDGTHVLTTTIARIGVEESLIGGDTPAAPTPSVYDQLVAQATAAATDAAQARDAATSAQSTATAAAASAATAAAGLASKADLVGGVLATSQLPALAITSFLGVVASESAMLALNGQLGDFCTRSDTSGMYIITGDDPTKTTSWTEINYPPAPVTSVNGQTGGVVIGKSDLGLGSVDNTSDVDKPISTAVQAALDAKQDALVHLTQAEYDALTAKDAATVYLVG